MEPEKVWVKFLVTRRVVPDGPTFKEGGLYELGRESAARWIKRGMAEVHGGPPPNSRSNVPPDDESDDTEAVESAEPPPAKRKRGRPRKNAAKPVETVVAERKQPEQPGDPDEGRAIRNDNSIAGVDAPQVAGPDDWPRPPA